MKTKNPAAVALGKLGGKATGLNLTPEQRKQRAQHAARTMWAKHPEKRKKS